MLKSNHCVECVSSNVSGLVGVTGSVSLWMQLSFEQCYNQAICNTLLVGAAEQHHYTCAISPTTDTILAL